MKYVRRSALKQQIAELQRELRRAANQRDDLLVFAFENALRPPGTYGPVSRMLVLEAEPAIHLASGDSLTVMDGDE